jgi:hypothetical protein
MGVLTKKAEFSTKVAPGGGAQAGPQLSGVGLWETENRVLDDS